MAETATTTATETTTTTAPPADWRAGLTGDFAPLAQDKSIESFKGKDWTEVGPALTKAFIETKKLVGTKPQGLVPPGDKATPEEKAAYDTALRKTLGVPEKPEGYVIKRPDVAQDGAWDAAVEKTFLAEMHKAGASPAVVQAALNVYGQFERQKLEMARQEANAAGAELRVDWGANYDAKVGRANRALQEFGGDALVEFLTQTGLGRDARMVRAWAAVGDALVESGAMTGEGVQGLDPAQAQTRITEARAELKKLPEGSPKAAALVDEIVSLTRVISAGR